MSQLTIRLYRRMSGELRRARAIVKRQTSIVNANFLAIILLVVFIAPTFAADEPAPGAVQCANLVYGNNKTSVCFSAKFLEQVAEQTNITTTGKFSAVRLESSELYQYPFAVMTGEGGFSLTQEQRDNLKDYLNNGGFLLASAGCSSPPWSDSFLQEIRKIFPDLKMTDLPFDHPIFHTVNDISRLPTNHGHSDAKLKGLEIDGKIVVVFSADGLNDTANAGGKCCCCGGAEIQNARQMNVNLLTYALTH